MNIRAAFLHNVADALGSVAVIVAGIAIIVFDWWIIDPIVTLMIAGYILWMAFAEIGGSIRMLMLGTPSDIDLDDLVAQLDGIEGVENVHHVHLWAIDENQTALEAHVVTQTDDAAEREAIKGRIKALLRETFGIGHSTLEFERPGACPEDHAQTIGHPMAGDHHGHSHA